MLAKCFYDCDDSVCDVLYKFVVEVIFTSYVMDDIEDSTILRNGKPTSYQIYGVSSTVYSVLYECSLFFNEAVTSLLRLNCDPNKVQQMVGLALGACKGACIGQGVEMYFQLSDNCPTLDQYLGFVDNKTVGLAYPFLYFFELFGKKRDSNADYASFLKMLFLYMQIMNDLDNMDNEKHIGRNKGFAEDLTEGKHSFPVLHAISNYPEDNLVESIRRMRTNDPKLKQLALDRMRKLGSFDYTRNYLEKMKQELKSKEAKFNLPFCMVDIVEDLPDN